MEVANLIAMVQAGGGERPRKPEGLGDEAFAALLALLVAGGQRPPEGAAMPLPPEAGEVVFPVTLVVDGAASTGAVESTLPVAAESPDTPEAAKGAAQPPPPPIEEATGTEPESPALDLQKVAGTDPKSSTPGPQKATGTVPEPSSPGSRKTAGTDPKAGKTAGHPPKGDGEDLKAVSPGGRGETGRAAGIPSPGVARTDAAAAEKPSPSGTAAERPPSTRKEPATRAQPPPRIESPPAEEGPAPAKPRDNEPATTERPAPGADPVQEGLRARAEPPSGPPDRTAALAPQPKDLPREIVRQVTVRVGNEVEVQLEPESLGKVRMKLTLSGDEVQARFLVTHTETKAILEGSLNLLRQALMEQGLQVGSLMVDLGPSGQRRERPAQGESRRPVYREPEVDLGGFGRSQRVGRLDALV